VWGSSALGRTAADQCRVEVMGMCKTCGCSDKKKKEEKPKKDKK
jgi:hypothetical protein